MESRRSVLSDTTSDGSSRESSGPADSPGSVRAHVESLLGADLSAVRFHTDSRAAATASRLNARAFTYETDVYFGQAAYKPQTDAGRRLIAHELVHAVQQRTGRTRVQRQEQSTEAEQTPKTSHPQPQPTVAGKTAKRPSRVGSYVVRDKGLDAGGGTYVTDLEDLKAKLQTRRTTGEWTLVLSIHGSENRLAAQSPPNMQKNAKFYRAADINRIFGADQSFVQWRTRWGPTRLVLYGCQVSVDLERTVIQNLTRAPASGSRQRAQGLGSKCKPLVTTRFIPSGVKTHSKWKKLPNTQQKADLEALRKLNRTWGYFGRPPVADTQLLHYYFEEVPKPGWPKMEVTVEGTGVTGIPFHSRMSNHTFLKHCDQGITLPEREPGVPPPVTSQ